MTVTLFLGAGKRLLDSNGNPLSGGKVFTYDAGTTTAKESYPTASDATAGTSANPNPVVLSSEGVPEAGAIWLDSQYKIVTKDKEGNTIRTEDNVGLDLGSNVLALNYLAGLAITINSSDSDHDIDVAAGEARDGADSDDMILSAAITKRIDAVWSVGTDQGGLDDGTVAANTDYFVHLIKRTDTAVVDVLISTSEAGPILPTNYTKKRVIGRLETDANANIQNVYGPDESIGGVSFSKGDATGLESINTASFNKNLLMNGCFRIAQRGTTFDSTTAPLNNDGEYLLDRWVLLSDGNDVVDVSQETSVVPSGAYAAIKADVETGNAKFGFLQIIEARDVAQIIGGTCSLSFKARVTGSSISGLRVGILAWDSTADTVTSDVVSAWNAAGADPTLVANWTYENTPETFPLTTSYQTFKIENVSIDTASTANVAVFIWIDDVTTTVGDFLYIADVQLEKGATATEFERRLVSTELMLCRRLFERFNEPDQERIGTGWVATATTARILVVLDVEKRSSPTLSLSAFGDLAVLHQGTSTAVTGASINGTGNRVVDVTFSVAAGLTAGEGCGVFISGASGFIHFDAEL